MGWSRWLRDFSTVCNPIWLASQAHGQSIKASHCYSLLSLVLAPEMMIKCNKNGEEICIFHRVSDIYVH